MQSSKMMGSSSANENNIFSWLELESDPGLFTLLVDDFGVKGVQVEEIYDLSKNLEESIFGFIFLFKWMERKSRRSKTAALDPNSNYVTDPDIVNKMFFAHQIVPNSCATHALLSILLNCKSRRDFDLGELLAKFQKNCDGLTPENKGSAIGNQPKLAQAHNSYAKPDNQSNRMNQINDSPYATSSSIASSSISSFSSLNNHQPASSSSNNCTSNSAYGKISAESSSTPGAEIFHFICFVPIEGHLYELDGLKPYPIDHGPISTETKATSDDNGNWTNKFKNIIKHRLSNFNSGQQNHEIRFNLMALVPDRMSQLMNLTDVIKHNCSKINELLSDFRNGGQLNESDLNIKSEIKIEGSIKKEQEEEVMESSTLIDTKQATRQLRSTRSTTQMVVNQKDDPGVIQNSTKTNEQFEISFQVSSSDIDDSQSNINDLCRKYRIESIKYFSGSVQRQLKLSDLITDLKEKENEIINKIKSQIVGNGVDMNDCKLEKYGDVLLFKKMIDLVGLKALQSKLTSEIESADSELNEEIEKRKKYRTDAQRRKHIYDEFIVTYLKILNEDGKLAELIRNNSYTCINTTNGNILQNQSNKRRKKLSN